MELHPGDLIKVRAYGNVELNRRLLEVRDGIAIITTDEDIELARREGRKPIKLGWRLHDVIEVVERTQ